MFPKTLLAIGLLLAISTVTALIWWLDQTYGLLAYDVHYIVVACGIISVFSTAWLYLVGRFTVIAGTLVALVLLYLLIMPPPAERYLQTAFRRISVGADVSEIESTVRQSFAGSSYVLPSIWTRQTNGKDLFYVSLLNQKPRRTTALIFEIRRGKVVSRRFMLD